MELVVVVVVLLIGLAAVIAVRSAADSIVTVTNEQLGTRTEAGTRELALHRDAIGERLDAMGGELARVNELVGTLQRERAQQHGELVEGLRATLRTTSELATPSTCPSDVAASCPWGNTCRWDSNWRRLQGTMYGAATRCSARTAA